ncbi:oxidoreductase, partial [Streptomyces sp. TRM76130]|nr:oxidoreductase [Streptomyces sp. TRM76130]
MKLVVVSAGLSVPSSTRLLGDRLAAATAQAVQAGQAGEAAQAAQAGQAGHVEEARQAAGQAGQGVPADVRVIELRDLAVPIAHTFTSG